jgi:hypothetical protein
MTYTSFPFDQQDTTEAQYSSLFRELQDSGVIGGYGDTTLAVGANSSAMSVTLQPGSAIVRGFHFTNDAVATLTIGASGGTVRYDAVVLQLDPVANTILPVVKANATATPTLTQTDTGVFEILLAVVTVPASAVTIASGNVADKRPWVRHRINVRPTTNRPASPRPYEVGIATDLGGRMETYEPANGWQSRQHMHWGTGTAFPTIGVLTGDTFVRSDMSSTTHVYDGSVWLPVSKINGKMWRTGGYSGSVAANTSTVCAMTSSRLSGGFTYSANALTIPYDGFYRIRGRCWVTTGVNHVFLFYAERTRPAVGVGTVSGYSAYKGTLDLQPTFSSSLVPLKAGDTLRMVFVPYGTASEYYGSDEMNGVSLEAEYAAPLNGVSPY